MRQFPHHFFWVQEFLSTYELWVAMSSISPLEIGMIMKIHLQEVIIGGLELQEWCLYVVIEQKVIHNQNDWWQNIMK